MQNETITMKIHHDSRNKSKSIHCVYSNSKSFEIEIKMKINFHHWFRCHSPRINNIHSIDLPFVLSIVRSFVRLSATGSNSSITVQSQSVNQRNEENKHDDLIDGFSIKSKWWSINFQRKMLQFRRKNCFEEKSKVSFDFIRWQSWVKDVFSLAFQSFEDIQWHLCEPMKNYFSFCLVLLARSFR